MFLCGSLYNSPIVQCGYPLFNESAEGKDYLKITNKKLRVTNNVAGTQSNSSL